MNTKMNIGTRVRAKSDRNVGRPFWGKEGTIVKVTDRGLYRVAFDDVPEGWHRDNLGCSGGTWTPDSLVPVSAASEEIDRPHGAAITFEGGAFEEIRGYAHDLLSRVNEARTNEVLREIATGGTVDAYTLIAIMPDVFTGCATRGAHSTTRREHARRAKALADVALGAIGQADDGLDPDNPTGMDLGEGQGDVAAELREARGMLARSEEIEESLREQLSAASEEIDRLQAEYGEETVILEEALAIARSEAGDAAEARDTLASVLDYAIERLPQPDRDRVFGFWDALQG